MVMMREREETLGLSFVWLLFGLRDEGSIVLNQPSKASHFLPPHYTVQSPVHIIMEIAAFGYERRGYS